MPILYYLASTQKAVLFLDGYFSRKEFELFYLKNYLSVLKVSRSNEKFPFRNYSYLYNSIFRYCIPFSLVLFHLSF